MNIQKLLQARTIFSNFYQAKISPRLSYKILKFCKPLEAEVTFYEQEKKKIIDNYALKDENGQPLADEQGYVRFDTDRQAEAESAIQQLNGLEVDVPKIKFTLDELSDFKLSVADMFLIEDFISDEVET